MTLGNISMRVIRVVVPVNVPLVILHSRGKHTNRRNGNKISSKKLTSFVDRWVVRGPRMKWTSSIATDIDSENSFQAEILTMTTVRHALT